VEGLMVMCIYDFGVLKIRTDQKDKKDVDSCPDHAIEQVATSSTTYGNKIRQQLRTPKKPSVQAPPKGGFLRSTYVLLHPSGNGNYNQLGFNHNK
jgi:hypothetical protein